MSTEPDIFVCECGREVDGTQGALVHTRERLHPVMGFTRKQADRAIPTPAWRVNCAGTCGGVRDVLRGHVVLKVDRVYLCECPGFRARPTKACRHITVVMEQRTPAATSVLATDEPASEAAPASSRGSDGEVGLTGTEAPRRYMDGARRSRHSPRWSARRRGATTRS